MCITFQVSIDPVAILTAASRPFGYLRDPEPRINSMEGAMDKLRGLKMDIDNQIQVDEHAGQTPTHLVQVWRDKVSAVDGKISKIKNNRRNCSANWCINRQVRKRMSDIVALLEEGDAFKNVTDKRVPPVVQELNVAEQPNNSSTDRYLSQLRAYLQEDGSRIIGIWGMGGVGKTTLLQRLNNEMHSSWKSGQTPPEFDHIIWAVASNDYKLGKLQRDVAQRLGLSLNGDEAEKARVIFDFLKDRSFLLLLDDLWQPLDFDEVGIPHPLHVGTSYSKQKVVFTTRDERVCGIMQARRKLKLECLNEDEAWQIFQVKVGEDTLQAHAMIPQLARRVAKECDGLPLALVVIGAAMSTKKTPMEWHNSIALLEKSRLHEMHVMEKDKFLPKLKFSYDNLADEIKQKCFLLCCLWPEDYSIKRTELIECWMGHGLIDESKFDNIIEAYDNGHELIGNLLATCLLEPGNDRDREVKMHDIVRDLALWIASNCGEKPNKFIVNSSASSLEDTQSEVERISLIRFIVIDTSSLPSNCSKIKTLILNNSKFQSILSGFFKGTPALTYLDLSCTAVSELPSEIGLLSNLLYLNLKFTRITSLPLELGNLRKLRFLILSHMTTGFFIPEGLFEKLEMLSVIDLSHSECLNWKEIFRLRGSLKGLKGLKGVGIRLNMTEDLQLLSPLSNMPIWKLQLFDMKGFEGPLQLGSLNNQPSIRKLQIDSCESLKVVSIDLNSQRNCLKRLEELTLRYLYELDEIVFRAVVPAEMMPSLTNLSIYHCNKLLNISWVMRLLSLKELYVQNCKNMNQVINEDKEGGGIGEVENVLSARKSGNAFPSLKIIFLSNLPNLRLIANGLLAFPSLEVLYVEGCPEMKTLPFGLEIIGKQLKRIRGTGEWWEELEMEEDVRAALLPLFEICALILTD